MEKCHFNVPEVKYLGLVIMADSIQADPARICAIQNLRKPPSASDVRSLLELINQRHDAAFTTTQHDHSTDSLRPSSPGHHDSRQTLVVAAVACDSGIG